jgi:hypothetical protein
MPLSYEIWHRRFAHLGPWNFQKVQKLVEAVTIDSQTPQGGLRLRGMQRSQTCNLSDAPMRRPTVHGDRIHTWRYLRLDRPHRLWEISLFLDLHRRRDSDDLSLRFKVKDGKGSPRILPQIGVHRRTRIAGASSRFKRTAAENIGNRRRRCARNTASTTKRRALILRSETASPNEPTGRFTKGYGQSSPRPSSLRNFGPNSLVLLHISKP